MNGHFPHISDRRSRDGALDILRSGGIVVLPTDTLYGFSAAISSPAAVNRITAIKRSDETKQYVCLAGSIETVEPYVRSFGCTSQDVLERAWPAALTGIFPAGKNCPSWIGDSIAFRVPALPPLLELLRELGEPVVSTSINLHGEPPLLDLSEIEERFGSSVDLIIAGPEKAARRAASTIVDFTGERPLVVREGDYSWGE